MLPISSRPLRLASTVCAFVHAAVVVVLAAGMVMPARAQAPGGQQPPPVLSPEDQTDRRITLRIYAPRAESVRLNADDMPGVSAGTTLTKSENGVWETVVGPLEPGAYR